MTLAYDYRDAVTSIQGVYRELGHGKWSRLLCWWNWQLFTRRTSIVRLVFPRYVSQESVSIDTVEAGNLEQVVYRRQANFASCCYKAKEAPLELDEPLGEGFPTSQDHGL